MFISAGDSDGERGDLGVGTRVCGGRFDGGREGCEQSLRIAFEESFTRARQRPQTVDIAVSSAESLKQLSVTNARSYSALGRERGRLHEAKSDG